MTRDKTKDRAARARYVLRQKELSGDKDRKLAAYERDGVRASLEMQQAARAVAQENTRLRELLRLHGISAETIDNFLRPTRVLRTGLLAEPGDAKGDGHLSGEATEGCGVAVP